MKPSELLRLVWINITQNKFKTIMTSIGIIVGAATIVMVIAIGKGGQEDVADQFKNLNAGAIDISYDGGDKNRGGNQSSDDSSDSGMMMMPSGSGAPSGSSSSGGSGASVLPQHKPEEWMTDPGCGYSLRLDAEMWMRDHIAEAFDIVPYGYLDGAEE